MGLPDYLLRRPREGAAVTAAAGYTMSDLAPGGGMIVHRGRLLDHVHLRVRDLSKAKAFYRAVLGALGHEVSREADDFISFDELWIDRADAAGPSHVHLAFTAADQDAVRRFHAAGLGAGGRDNGGPGERRYHPGYYAAFVLDPDGHNVEAVYHGPGRWNVPSVEITTL